MNLKTTVGEAVIDALKAGNYSAIRGLLLEHAKRGGGLTTVIRLLERIDDRRLGAIILELNSEEDEDVHRLASAAVSWNMAYLKMLEDD